MRRIAFLLGAAALSTPASAQTDGLAPVAPAVFANAARSCADAISGSAVDSEKLRSDGWSEGTLSAQGEPVANPLRFFGREGVLLLLMAPATDGQPSCTVLGRAKSVADLVDFSKVTGAALGNGRVIKSEAGEIVWMLAGAKVAQFNTTGTKKKPSARVTIVGLAAEKK